MAIDGAIQIVAAAADRRQQEAYLLQAFVAEALATADLAHDEPMLGRLGKTTLAAMGGDLNFPAANRLVQKLIRDWKAQNPCAHCATLRAQLTTNQAAAEYKNRMLTALREEIADLNATLACLTDGVP